MPIYTPLPSLQASAETTLVVSPHHHSMRAVQAFYVLTDRMECGALSGLDAACLATAGPDEIR
jgi:hypothetical protein